VDPSQGLDSVADVKRSVKRREKAERSGTGNGIQTSKSGWSRPSLRVWVRHDWREELPPGDLPKEPEASSSHRPNRAPEPVAPK
jgi:hypothetical protein